MRFAHTLITAAVFVLSLLPAAPNALAWSADGFKKPTADELKKRLTPLQFAVTQEEDTEHPFKNEYWHNEEAGIYVDVVSGEPLFSSLDKFDSGTGWPSFTKPLAKENIVEKKDTHFFVTRTEVRSRHGDSHLGHVFDDGPKPLGLRYCMNSAALRFIPAAKLQEAGYGEFAPLFARTDKPASDSVVFAGGCFWCMEPPFEKLDGVTSVISGFSGGHVPNPSYEQVSSGTTGHVESVRVTYDPARISYEKLLEVFWRQIDPTDAGGQFVDRGAQYRSVIFVKNDAESATAEASKAKLAATGRFKKPIVTEILPFKEFYPAEEYHQDYYKKNPIRYKYYRYHSGRDEFLDKVWGEGQH